MALIVDTSAWIEFFKPRGNPQVKRAITAALEEGVVVTAARPSWSSSLLA